MTHKFHSIYGIDLREIFISCFNIGKALPVEFMHDAHAFVSGEHWNGNAIGYKRVIAATIGTGVGFGAIIDNKILHNGQGGPYISLYRKPCKDGILEDYVSAWGIIREYCQISGVPENIGIDAKEIGRRAEKDQDFYATETYRQVGKLLGESLIDIVSELEVECLVLGGQIAKSFDLFKDTLSECFRGTKRLKKITEAKNTDESPLIGAARLILA